MTPRVSIGMPLYNAERYLEQTLDSILAQTFADFELIICDNASTDGTEAICRRYAARDGRIAYSRNPRNLGATYNFNRTFALAHGEYFRHAAYDDPIEPTYLERCVALLDAHPEVVLAYPQSRLIDEDGGPHRGNLRLTDLNLRMPRPHERFEAYLRIGLAERLCDPVFGLFRRAVLARTPVIGNYVSSDAILLGEIALSGQIAEIPEALFLRRFHKNGSVLANPTIDDRYAWFDPALRGNVWNRLFRWRWLLELMKAIGRAPLGPLERLRCYLALRIFLSRYGFAMARNFAAVVTLALARLRPPVGPSPTAL